MLLHIVKKAQNIGRELCTSASVIKCLVKELQNRNEELLVVCDCYGCCCACTAVLCNKFGGRYIQMQLSHSNSTVHVHYILEKCITT